MENPALIRVVVLILAVSCIPIAVSQEIQPAPLASSVVGVEIDSGPVTNTGPAHQIVYSDVVSVPGATWLRLKFDVAELPGDPLNGADAILVITSLLDGAFQTMNAQHVAQWKNTSAYLNGDAVLIEIIAPPGVGPSRVVINEVTAGAIDGSIGASICGSTDDRQLSSDPRAARVVPVGCSVWMINDCNHCFLTAGHCQGSMDVVQFNVPLSTSGGGYQSPPPQDQYAVDDASLQGNGGQGVGNDWAYFGVFPNSTTGLTPFEAQGDSYILASSAPPVAGQQIRITGYGTVSSPISMTWNGVQKTHTGPFETSSGTTVQYVTDTTGGNSGSPVIEEGTGLAIGIHTHGGCTSGGGQNSGTAIQHSGLQAALTAPMGVCAGSALTFTFPNGTPDVIAASGGTTVRVEVADGGVAPSAGTGELHYDAGAGVVTVAMQIVSDNVYDAVFPAIDCDTSVEFFFSAQGANGVRYYNPGGCIPPGPGAALLATSAVSVDVLVSDDFQIDSGWTAGAPGDDATTGVWTRVNPVGTAAQPGEDHTPGAGGRCWVTGQGPQGGSVGENDVDNGTTTLLSPVFDLSADVDARISYWRWYSNDAGASPNADVFVIDINDGAGWVNVETVGPTGPEAGGGWFFHEFMVSDIVAPSAAVQLRFVASDLGSGSIVEAAIDDFAIRVVSCDPPACPGDLDGSGAVDLPDLSLQLANFGVTSGAQPEDGDMDGDGDVDLSDLSLLLALFGNACG